MEDKRKRLKRDEDFDCIGGYIGGLNDIPTKQDKYKPIQNAKVIAIKDDGSEEQLTDVYVMNHKVKQSIKDFEELFRKNMRKVKTDEHPYNKDIPLEIIINVKMSNKRYNNVDVDNIAKCVIDIMKGELFEDDSQVQGLFIYKEVPTAIPLEQHGKSNAIIVVESGVIWGIRRLDKRDSLMSGRKFYHTEDVK